MADLSSSYGRGADSDWRPVPSGYAFKDFPDFFL